MVTHAALLVFLFLLSNYPMFLCVFFWKPHCSIVYSFRTIDFLFPLSVSDPPVSLSWKLLQLIKIGNSFSKLNKASNNVSILQFISSKVRSILQSNDRYLYQNETNWNLNRNLSLSKKFLKINEYLYIYTKTISANSRLI